MTASRTNYARVFKPRLSETAVSQMWQEVDSTLRREPPRVRSSLLWLAAAGVFLVALSSVAAVTLLRTNGPHAVTGAVVEAPRDSRQILGLPDGSTVQLEAGARARVARLESKEVIIELKRGAAWFDVTHSAGRRFVVRATDVEVHVVGTRFRVAFDEGNHGRGVSVEVSRGIVEVRLPGGRLPLALEGGERWVSGAHGPSHAPTEPQSVPESIQSAESPAMPGASGTSRPPAPAVTRHVSDDAAALFDAANQARVAGRTEEAARAFDRFRRSYRSDARAALAAFQLGRLRMDDLGAPAAAAEAFADALALGGNASLRDDALARLVEAHDRSGNSAACRKAQLAYLGRESSGAHRAVVQRRCGGGGATKQ